MSEDDSGEIRDELRVYKEQLDELRGDLKLLSKHSPQAKKDILATSNQKGNPGYDQAEVKRCQEFVDKYQIRIGCSVAERLIRCAGYGSFGVGLSDLLINGANRLIGIGRMVVVLCSLEISFIVCKKRSCRAIGCAEIIDAACTSFCAA
jgi:hypothetical protein